MNLRLFPGCCVAALAVGCGDGPGGVQIPSIDPAAAAATALKTWDQDGDALLDEDEMAAAPGLRAAARQIDQNADGKISSDELRQRLQTYVDAGVGAVSVICNVTLDGRPLSGARVTFIPEPFLQDVLQEATGITNRSGAAALTINAERRIPGVQLGMYRVNVSKRDGPRESVPPKYNDATTLGFDVSPDPHAGNASFDLQR